MAKKFDLIVVGGGTSGLEAAKTAAENGLTVALLERKTDPGKIQRSCAQMFLMNMDSFYNERMYFSRETKKWVFPVNNFTVNYLHQVVTQKLPWTMNPFKLYDRVMVGIQPHIERIKQERPALAKKIAMFRPEMATTMMKPASRAGYPNY